MAHSVHPQSSNFEFVCRGQKEKALSLQNGGLFREMSFLRRGKEKAFSQSLIETAKKRTARKVQYVYTYSRKCERTRAKSSETRSSWELTEIVVALQDLRTYACNVEGEGRNKSCLSFPFPPIFFYPSLPFPNLFTIYLGCENEKGPWLDWISPCSRPQTLAKGLTKK